MIEDKKILLVPKITKVEWDLHRLGFREEQLKEFYKKENLNYGRIFESHKKQKENFEKINKLLKNARTVGRNELTKEIAKHYDLIVAFGGDNHFQFVSHFIEENLIFGINSDPERSEGILTNLHVAELEKIFNRGEQNNFKVEEWPRLKIEINGKEIEELAISEVFIGEERRFNMSRHVVKFKESLEEQKGSGFLISTGAGSTGWYNSASRYLFPEGNIFSKSLKEARFILTEPYNGRLSKYKLINGKIKDKEFLEIISLSDSSPYLSIDSLKLIKLREGATIKIKIGKPLKVVKLK